MRKFLILLLTIIIGVVVYLGYNRRVEKIPQPVIIHDTVMRIDTVVRQDTVIREKVVWQEVTPETVIVYKDIDLREVYGDIPEMILNLWKSGNRLKIQGARQDEYGWQIRDYIFNLDRYTTDYSIFTTGNGFFREAKETMDNRAWNIYRAYIGSRYSETGSCWRSRYQTMEIVCKTGQWNRDWDFI